MHPDRAAHARRIAEDSRTAFAAADLDRLGRLLLEGAALRPGVEDDADVELRSALLLAARFVSWTPPSWLAEEHFDDVSTPARRQLSTVVPWHRALRRGGAAWDDLVAAAARAAEAMPGPADDPRDLAWVLDTGSHLAGRDLLTESRALLGRAAGGAQRAMDRMHRTGMVASRAGRPRDVLAVCDDLLEACEHGQRWYFASTAVYRIQALEQLGQVDDARALAVDAAERCPEDGDLAVFAADLSGDLVALTEAVPRVVAPQVGRIQPWLRLARHQLAAGSVTAARDSLQEEVRVQREEGTPGLLAQALVELARLDQRSGELMDEAVALAAGSQRGRTTSVVQTAWSRHLTAAGDVRAARRAAELGLDRAVADGRTADADDALRALREAGGRPRRLRRTGPDALTHSQLRVALAVAQGMTNREVGKALWLSDKTVESHLRAAFRKLGVQQRGQLAEALSSTGASTASTVSSSPAA